LVTLGQLIDLSIVDRLLFEVTELLCSVGYTQQTWGVQTLHIPKKGLAMVPGDKFEVNGLPEALGQARQPMLTMRFMVEALSLGLTVPV
jgi:hypothetical protein